MDKVEIFLDKQQYEFLCRELNFSHQNLVNAVKTACYKYIPSALAFDLIKYPDYYINNNGYKVLNKAAHLIFYAQAEKGIISREKTIEIAAKLLMSHNIARTGYDINSLI